MNKFQSIVAARGLTLSKLSKISGVNRGTLSKLYKGETKCENLTYRNLKLLSQALGVDMEDLVDEEQEG